MILRCLDKIPDSLHGLWYYPTINRFVDEDGRIFQGEITDILPNWLIRQFKEEQDYMLVIGRDGQGYELYWVDDDGCYEICKE